MPVRAMDLQQLQTTRTLAGEIPADQRSTLIWVLGMCSLVELMLAFTLGGLSVRPEWPYRRHNTWPVGVSEGNCVRYCKLRREGLTSWAVKLKCSCNTNVTGDGEDENASGVHHHFHYPGGIDRASLDDELAMARFRYADAHDCLGRDDGQAEKEDGGRHLASWCPSRSRCIRALWETCPEGTAECQELCLRWTATRWGNTTVDDEVNGTAAFPCNCDGQGHALDMVPGDRGLVAAGEQPPLERAEAEEDGAWGHRAVFRGDDRAADGNPSPLRTWFLRNLWEILGQLGWRSS